MELASADMRDRIKARLRKEITNDKNPVDK